MAITTLTASTQAAAINYAYTTSGTTDWSGIANNTYFYDLTTKLPYFKDSGGNIQNAFFTGGTISGSLTATTVSATTFYGNGSNLTGISGGGSFSGGTVSNASVFTGGLSANTLTLTSVPVNDDTTTQILSRDATTGAVEYINLSAITSYNYGLSFALANSVYLT
jgi:hypothetical protein